MFTPSFLADYTELRNNVVQIFAIFVYNYAANLSVSFLSSVRNDTTEEYLELFLFTSFCQVRDFFMNYIEEVHMMTENWRYLIRPSTM